MRDARKLLISCITLMALAAAPAATQAGATPVQTDDTGVAVQRLAALDGTIVWISGSTLMQRDADGAVAPVAGAPAARYRSIDLGRDAAGELVLTYVRCATSGSRCQALSDDLAGHRASFKKLAPRRCRLTTVPARWRNRVAYGLDCFKLSSPTAHDAKRSGLFVRTGAGAPQRLRTERFGISPLVRVDLRGTVVGAMALGPRSYAFTQTVHGARMHATLIADNRKAKRGGEVLSMSLGSGGALWTLVSGEDGSGYWETIGRLGATGCAVSQSLPVANPPYDADDDGGSSGPNPPELPASALAVDGDTIHLLTPHAGVTTHAFSPTSGCPQPQLARAVRRTSVEIAGAREPERSFALTQTFEKTW